jgi:tetratricopeptide (TPR) repeat protein
MNKQAVRWTLLLIVLVALAWGGVVAYRADRGLVEAERYARKGQWLAARSEIKRYLRLHPHDALAHLHMAEALTVDNDLAAEEAVPRALAHLGQIPDASPRASRARTQEGRLALLLLHRPGQAEAALRRAVELDPQNLDAALLLWKLMNLTGRSQLAEDDFWSVYELTPAVARGELLREWYMSQFFPLAANTELDQRLCLLAAHEQTTATTENQRFVLFRNAERDGPLGHAALARWFLEEGDPQFARKLLDEALPQVSQNPDHPFLLATRVNTLYDLGDFAAAAELFDRWPDPRVGYEYWRWRAILFDDVHDDYEQALAAYDQALRVWPGSADWRTRFRKANCLAKMRRPDEADRERAAAKVIEELMAEDIHKRLRKTLNRLDDRNGLETVVAYYEQLGRPREVAGWREYIDGLPRPASSSAKAEPAR